ncbi:carotenoid ester lipase [Coprinopsis cinerea AmutBmut pab1-1]|nr:carotenoid ester lipase [Coprinopsis cinerea AmutBmut pab1-1]
MSDSCRAAAFELSSLPRLRRYDGSGVVARSISQREPVVFVSMNYRLNGFGFMAGKEVRNAGVGNLGLHDQREALRWIKKHISAFGGDPDKVTIWGESAGAISAALQMVAFDGNSEGLFRGAFMQSGAPIPVGPIENGQGYYDDVVRDTGCADATDTLQCLRTVPYDRLKAAIDSTPGIFDYQSLRLTWLPREDGVFLTDEPLKLVQQGKVANIPYVNGNCDDEGTLFSIATMNVTTDAEFRSWLGGTFLPNLSAEQVDGIARHYSQRPSEGSPFGTGLLNAITPQFKRFAAFQGDGVFQAPRRWFLRHTAHKQNVWAYGASSDFVFL